MPSSTSAAALIWLASALSTVRAGSQGDIPPQKAFLPAVHWDHNKADLQHLVPVDSHKLYYSDKGVADPALEHAFAHLTTTLQHPAVILDHSDYIKSVQCKGHDIEIIFTDNEGYAFAQNAWAAEKDFILSTYTNGCGLSANQRSFWSIDHLTQGGCGTCITAVVKEEIATENALHEVDLVWGTYKPAENAASSKASPRFARAPVLKRQAPTNSTGNSTVGECGRAASKLIDGFPTATCNSTTFDQDLDDAIGYFRFDTENYAESLQGFAPGLGDYAPEDNEGFGPAPSSRLHRRKKGNWFADKIAAALAKTVQAAAALARNVGQAITNGASKVGNRINEALAVNEKIDLNLSIGVAPAPESLVESPFTGNAVKIYSKPLPKNRAGADGMFTAYCVNCAVDGRIQLGGRASWTIKTGLREATVEMNGNLRAGASLGIDINAEIQKTYFEREIVLKGIPGFELPGVLIVGPAIRLAVEADVTVALQGQVLAGINMNIPNFAATLDFLDGQDSKATGFTPQYTRIFNASAQISATTSFGLPVSIGVGIYVPALNRKLDASINNKAAIEGGIKYTASNTCAGPGGDTTCVNGIGLNLDFVNTVYADLAGRFKYNLADQFRRPLGAACFRVGPQVPNCPAPSTRRRGLHNSKPQREVQLIERQDQSATGTTANITASASISNITAPETNATANDNEWRRLNETIYASIANATHSTRNGSQVVAAPDTNFTTISDLSGLDDLIADADGNLYYASRGNGSLFALVSGFVEGDEFGRFFHYYPDVMKAYGVSRFRLSDEDHTPLTSDIIGLAPVNYNDNSATPDAYIAVDTVGGVFFPVTCDLVDQPSKLFLVREVASGVRTLQDPKLRNTVTGGRVEECYFLPLRAPAGAAERLPSAAAANATADAIAG